jgi:altronate dehydratase small subunit
MTIGAFKIHPDDNVATLLADAGPGAVAVGGVAAPTELALAAAIELGHKVALADIAADAAIIKFGIAIGFASRDVRRGEWVHLHNCRSGFDTRSGTLDLHTGATTDTRYE